MMDATIEALLFSPFLSPKRPVILARPMKHTKEQHSKSKIVSRSRSKRWSFFRSVCFSACLTVSILSLSTRVPVCAQTEQSSFSVPSFLPSIGPFLAKGSSNNEGPTGMIGIDIHTSSITAIDQPSLIEINWIINLAATEMSATVGDTVVFNFESAYHNVYIHPNRTCEKANSILVGNESGSTYEFTEADVGEVTFACQVNVHCVTGQILTFSVSSNAVPPSSTPTIDPPLSKQPAVTPTFVPSSLPSISPARAPTIGLTRPPVIQSQEPSSMPSTFGFTGDITITVGFVMATSDKNRTKDDLTPEMISQITQAYNDTTTEAVTPYLIENFPAVTIVPQSAKIDGFINRLPCPGNNLEMNCLDVLCSFAVDSVDVNRNTISEALQDVVIDAIENGHLQEKYNQELGIFRLYEILQLFGPISTFAPSISESLSPTDTPAPSSLPPTTRPTLTLSPSITPTTSLAPSDIPTMSSQPSLSTHPSLMPTLSISPSILPTISNQPSGRPSGEPSSMPSLSFVPTRTRFTGTFTLKNSIFFSNTNGYRAKALNSTKNALDLTRAYEQVVNLQIANYTETVAYTGGALAYIDGTAIIESVLDTDCPSAYSQTYEDYTRCANADMRIELSIESEPLSDFRMFMEEAVDSIIEQVSLFNQSLREVNLYYPFDVEGKVVGTGSPSAAPSLTAFMAPTRGDPELGNGAIAGIAIGGIVGLMLLCGVSIYLGWQRSSQRLRALLDSSVSKELSSLRALLDSPVSKETSGYPNVFQNEHSGSDDDDDYGRNIRFPLAKRNSNPGAKQLDFPDILGDDIDSEANPFSALQGHNNDLEEYGLSVRSDEKNKQKEYRRYINI